MRMRIASRNATLLDRGAELDGGFVRFYDGAVPPDPDTALGANTLGVECALGNPACAAPDSATIAFNIINPAVVAVSFTPTFARFFRSDGVTAVVDMDVPGEITLSKSDWVAGDSFAGPGITWSMPVEC